MTPSLPPELWAHSIGSLAAQVALILLVAALFQSRRVHPRTRRYAWRLAFLAAALLLANAFGGIDRWAARHLATSPSSPPRFILRANLPATDPSRHPSPAPTPDTPAAIESPEPPAQPASNPQTAPTRWPLGLWLAGSLALGLRAVVQRIRLAIACRHAIASHAAAPATTRVAALARQLGLPRPPRVLHLPGLSAPIAFGILRPTVGLPAGFPTHPPAEQEVMLSHELAHLAARDPLWQTVANFVAALLWWHPLIWWARRQLHAAGEGAADEASLVVENGPAILAGCLVNLAARWQEQRQHPSLGMAGFRSGLGRRVERLLNLPATPPLPHTNWRLKAVALATLSASLATAVAMPFWLLPGSIESRASIGSLLTATLASAPTPPPPPADPAPPAPGNPPPEPTPQPASPDPLAARIEDARLLLELGKIPEARAKLEEVLRQSPDHPLAIHHLNLIREAEWARSLSATQADTPSPETTPPSPPPPTPPSAETGPTNPGPSNGSPPPSPSSPVEPLETQLFRLDPASLTGAYRAIGSPASTETNTLPPFLALQRMLESAGVDLTASPGDPPATAATPPSTRSLIYNERTGMLLVRATAKELAAVEQLLQVLNTAPPQVLLQATFVEVTDAGGPLSFDWSIGNQPMGRTSVGDAPSPTPATVTSLLNDPQFRSVLSALEQNPTNRTENLRGDQLDWPGRQAPRADQIQVTAAIGSTLAGTLSDAEFRALLQSLQQRAGVDILAAPRITTLSGRRAQIQMVNIRSVITGVAPAALRKPGVTPGTNAAPFLSAQIPVGPTLDVLPTVAADGRSIQLKLTPAVTEFLGYDQPPKGAKVRIWEDGSSRLVQVPLPRFRVRQMETATSVADGQTVVIGGLSVEESVLTRDQVPVLGDLPLLGRLFRKQGRQTLRKHLLVFVTPTIVDPAGNPVHTANSQP